MEEIEYIRSNKGGQKIIHRGYMYTVHKNKKCGGIRWRCAQRSLNCKGSISTTSLGVPYLNIPHNHMPDAQSIAIARNKIFDHGAIDFHNFLDLLMTDEQCASASGPAVLDVTNVWEPLTELEDEDSMPLEQRLKVPASTTVLTPPPEAQATEQVLQSQPLSPTKLKVTRQVKPSAPSPIPPPITLPIEEVCLRWNSHHSNMQHTFPNLLLREQYVDATLVADGQTLKCHRVILSSCSPYFEDVLASISPYQHPVLFMKDVPFWILKCLCDFMYSGEVHVLRTKLEDLLVVAETLKIKGLAVQPDTKMIDTKPEFTIPIKEEKFDEREIKKKEEKEFRRKEEKEVKKREEKEIKKKEEKEVKKKEEKEVKKKEEYKKKDEKEMKKKEEMKLPEIKPIKKKEDKEFAKKDEKQTKKKEEIKEIKEKKRVTIIPSPERPVVKNAKVPKVVAQTPVPILKNLGVKANRPRSAVESRRRDRKLEKEKLGVEKIPITQDAPSTSSFANPFGLLKPVYEEVTKDPKPSKVAVVKDPKNVNIKRTLQKKLKKRKMTDEREESPPPALSRKGTRSRPRSKVAKYYHPTPVPSYDQSTIVREPHTDQADAFLQIQDIKSEPLYDDSIEIEDNLVGFSESSISVEEHLIDSYDSTFDNFNRRTTRHSKPIITVQSLVNEHTLKIVNVAELKENNDPLEDPLGLNQSSSDSASMVEQTDNTLGFRISKVVTAKEDSQSSDVCRELGFKIASIVSEQEEDEKLETTKIEATYEEEEFEDEKPIFSLIQPENTNKDKMDTNEDELISCPEIISYKIKEELIENIQERTTFEYPNETTHIEMNQTVLLDAFEEEKIELPNQLLHTKISIIQEAHLSEENLLKPDESDSSTVQKKNTETCETTPESELKKNCQFKSSSNAPQFEDKSLEVNKVERMEDLYFPQSGSSANAPIEDKNVAEDSEMKENFEYEDYNSQQVTGENFDSKDISDNQHYSTESSSNIPDLSNSEKETLNNEEENSSNVPFHRDENQPIEESSSNIPDSHTDAFHYGENQHINDDKERSSNEHSEAFHCDENQPIDNNFEESSSNIPDFSNPVNEQTRIDEEENNSVLQREENQPLDDIFEENSENLPQVDESSSDITQPTVLSINENKESSSNVSGSDHNQHTNNGYDESTEWKVDSSCNVPQVGEFSCNENQLAGSSYEDDSSNAQLIKETDKAKEGINNSLNSTQLNAQSDENYYEESNSQHDKQEKSYLDQSEEDPTIPFSMDITQEKTNSEDSYNKNSSKRFEDESRSDVPPEIVPLPENLQVQSMETDSGEIKAKQARGDEIYYQESNFQSFQFDKEEESCLDSQSGSYSNRQPEVDCENSNNKPNSDVLEPYERCEDESSSNIPPEMVPLPEDIQDQSMETNSDEIRAKQAEGDENHYEESNSQSIEYDKEEGSCLDSQYRQPEVDCENSNSKTNFDVLEPYERCEDEISSNVPPDIVPLIKNPQTNDYNLLTENMSSSNEPGFHIAQVISEQIAEIEGNRVVDTSSVNEQCENKVSNSNELESIVNDLSRIVGGSCEESTTGTDDTNSMADSLENLLQK